MENKFSRRDILKNSAGFAGLGMMGHRFTAVDVMVGSARAWGREFAPKSELMDRWLARITDRPANLLATAKDGTPPVMAEVA